jgi:hypothetical protein
MEFRENTNNSLRTSNFFKNMKSDACYMQCGLYIKSTNIHVISLEAPFLIIKERAVLCSSKHLLAIMKIAIYKYKICPCSPLIIGSWHLL